MACKLNNRNDNEEKDLEHHYGIHYTISLCYITSPQKSNTNSCPDTADQPAILITCHHPQLGRSTAAVVLIQLYTSTAMAISTHTDTHTQICIEPQEAKSHIQCQLAHKHTLSSMQKIRQNSTMHKVYD